MQKQIQIEKNFTVRLKGSYVYIHRRKSDGIVFYVGKGINTRWHRTYGRNNYWKNVANKHGVFCEIVANSLTENEANLLEKKLIEYHGRLDLKTGTLVNLTIGGEGVCGYVCTPERRRQISKSNTGRIHTEETKAKISKVHKGKVVSEEARKKISASRKGRKHTPSMMEALQPHFESMRIKVICVETGIIYDSQTHAAIAINGCSSCISKVCRFKREKHKGLTWRYLPQEIPSNNLSNVG